MDDELVTIGRLARILHVSVRWLREETDADRIPHVRAGRETLYSPDAVRHSLAARARQHPAALASKRRQNRRSA